MVGLEFAKNKIRNGTASKEFSDLIQRTCSNRLKSVLKKGKLPNGHPFPTDYKPVGYACWVARTMPNGSVRTRLGYLEGHGVTDLGRLPLMYRLPVDTLMKEAFSGFSHVDPSSGASVLDGDPMARFTAREHPDNPGVPDVLIEIMSWQSYCRKEPATMPMWVNHVADMPDDILNEAYRQRIQLPPARTIPIDNDED